MQFLVLIPCPRSESCLGKITEVCPSAQETATASSAPFSAAWQLSPLAHNGTRHTSRICCLSHQFNLKTPSCHSRSRSRTRSHSYSHFPARRHQFRFVCVLLLRALSQDDVAYFSACRVNWVVLHSLNKSLDGKSWSGVMKIWWGRDIVALVLFQLQGDACE